MIPLKATDDSDSIECTGRIKKLRTLHFTLINPDRDKRYTPSLVFKNLFVRGSSSWNCPLAIFVKKKNQWQNVALQKFMHKKYINPSVLYRLYQAVEYLEIMGLKLNSDGSALSVI